MSHSNKPMAATTQAPALHPPLRVRWSVAIDTEYIRRRPATDGRSVVAVAAHDRVLGLALGSGETMWDHSQPQPIAEIQACADGPVIALGGEDDVELVAFRWSGEPLWRTKSGIGTGSDRLRGCGTRLVAVGVPVGRSTRQMCQVRDARTGELMQKFVHHGDLPDMIDDRFIYSVRAGEPGSGLYVYHAPSKKKRRLLGVGNWVRVVHDGIVVIDTFDDDNRFSRLIAVDLGTEQVIWEDDGGPNFALAADRGQIAAAMAVDDKRIAMTLRDLRTGQRLWTAEAVEAEEVTPLLAADCVIATIVGERIDIYDRATGRLAQSLAYASNVVKGGWLTQAELIDVNSPKLSCFAGDIT